MNGKKVFFVQPNSVIQKEMVSELIRQEYEVLLIPEAGQARRIFEKYPDCLAFLNIDEGYSEPQWDELVQDIQSDPALENVKLGILSYNTDPELAQKYLMDRMLPCGFIKLSLGLAESTKIVLKVLEANEARGRRKYLRVHCGDKTKLNFKLSSGAMVDGRLVDLSSVGMACTLNTDQELELHSKLESIQLQLKGTLCLVDGVVMGSRPLEDGSGKAYVVLFDPKIAPVQKEKIRAYLQWALQASIEHDLHNTKA